MKPLDNAVFYNRDQSWYMRQHHEHKSRKLRVIVRRGAYAQTSSAVLQVQDATTLGWVPLAYVPEQDMKAQACYAVNTIREAEKLTFLEDQHNLLQQAEMLI
jgi:chemotaxis signal transduction protein